jgi:predicted metalloprotease with PDZ domain
MSNDVAYTVDLAARHEHLYAVEAVFPVGGATVDLMLPVWTPGSYLIREFQRHIQEVVAEDSQGQSLPVRKIDKSTWRVDARKATEVRVRYRVYAWDLTVRAAHLDDTHAFWNGACLFLYTPGLRHERHLVRIKAPADWRVITALDNNDGAYVATDYDELVDSPFEVGTDELLEFVAQGRRHRMSIWGRCDTPRTELVADLTKLIDAAANVFRGTDDVDPIPYDHYTFILLISAGGYGGLEHARSTTLLISPLHWAPRKKYEEFLELVCHEYFHLWNVKRIRPAALGPFDYQREAYTRSLWVMEGVTSYYDRYLLVRAGLLKPERYLEVFAEEMARMRSQPGRLVQSLEDASFDAWIKYYRPDENSGNSTISYYLKGGIVALLLDLHIRAQSAGAKSLDDVMRALYRRWKTSGASFADDELQALMEEASGVSLGAFLDELVRGRGEVDANPYLRPFGLELRPVADDEPPRRGHLGATLKEGDALRVSSVASGSPAAAAGLYAGDEIVALDGLRGSIVTRLGLLAPGAVAKLSIFRRDELRTLEVTLGAPVPDELEVVPIAEPTDEQKAAYTAWLGTHLAALNS